MKSKIKTPEKGIPIYKALLLLVIGILLTVGITSIFYSSHKILNYKEYNTYVNVTGKNEVGFNLDPGVFNFGKVPQGAIAKRNATINHKYPFDVLVKIDITGNAKNLVSTSENYFILSPNITKNIEVMANVPENYSMGLYSGKIQVYFLRQ